MKIAYLTAGAAGMFCGSCLHDNALAKQLIAKGHDCLLVPVYTPIRTDDEDVSIDRVFMGGINVFLQQKLPWLAYTPRWLDHFLNHPWLIQPLTKNAGKTSPRLLGALTVSMLKGTSGRQRKEFLRMLDWLEKEIKPDAIILTNLLIGGCIPDIKKRSKSKVYVTLQGDDIFLDALPPEFRSQSIALMSQLSKSVDGFIVHSHYYSRLMSDTLNIPIERFQVVPLAISTRDFQTISPETMREPTNAPILNRFTIGYLARMAPEKGLHQLVDAFIAIANLPDYQHLFLKLAGWMGPQHEIFWEEQKRKLDRAGLADRWEYAGAIDRTEKTQFLNSLNLFCVPTTYADPKGLYLLEAVASGVPYLQPSHGAFPELHNRMVAAAKDIAIGELYNQDSLQDLTEKIIAAVDRNSARYIVPENLLNEIDISQHAKRVLKLLGAESD